MNYAWKQDPPKLMAAHTFSDWKFLENNVKMMREDSCPFGILNEVFEQLDCLKTIKIDKHKLCPHIPMQMFITC